MWHKFTRNLEWLLIVALLVGAVAAVGCGDGHTSSLVVEATADKTTINIGQLVNVDGHYYYVDDSDPTNVSIPTVDVSIGTWRFVEIPLGATMPQIAIRPEHPLGNRISFVPLVAGDYVIEFEVYGQASSPELRITAVDPNGGTVPPKNIPPIARASENLVWPRIVGQLINLDGSGSTDENNIALSYLWRIDSVPVGSIAALTNPIAVNPSFTPDIVGNYEVSLVVNDGIFDSAPDSITLSVTAAGSGGTTNTAPVANAGTDQNATVGNTVTLNGINSSDADSDPYSFAWTLTNKPAGSSATLSGANGAYPTFVPDQAGDYIASLVVNDGTANSAADTVTITAAPPSGPPTYVADTQSILTNNTFLVTNSSAVTGLLEVLEFGTGGLFGSMTFTSLNDSGPHLRRDSSWNVNDGGGYALIYESILFAQRYMNSATPVNATNTLTVPGYATYNGVTGSEVETWIKVAPVTTLDFSGKTVRLTSNTAIQYQFTSATDGQYNDGSTVWPFTWAIDSIGRKAVLTFTGGSTHHLFLTVRGASVASPREMAVLSVASDGTTATSGGFLSWNW